MHATATNTATVAKVLQLRAQARRTARAAGLVYVSEDGAGIRRQKKGKGFVYTDTRGRPVRDAAVLARIRKLAIPPAWTEVWICPKANGHIQATGRDARGRKQYRYHALWSATRDADKHRRICEFARLLPKLRAACRRQLRKPGMSREVVLAGLLRVVDLTSIRVGNEEYTRANSSHGLTTLQPRHVRVRGSEVEFKFRGKSGVLGCVRFRDRRLAKLISACRELRGKKLFQYLDATGTPRPIRSEHVNAYLRSLTEPRFSVKDFRTWSATVRVALALRTSGTATSQRAAKKSMLEAIRATAQHLGNTPSVCRKSYIHPGVLDAYLEGETLPPGPAGSRVSQAAQEAMVLAFLEGRKCAAALARSA